MSASCVVLLEIQEHAISNLVISKWLYSFQTVWLYFGSTLNFHLSSCKFALWFWQLRSRGIRWWYPLCAKHRHFPNIHVFLEVVLSFVRCFLVFALIFLYTLVCSCICLCTSFATGWCVYIYVYIYIVFVYMHFNIHIWICVYKNTYICICPRLFCSYGTLSITCIYTM